MFTENNSYENYYGTRWAVSNELRTTRETTVFHGKRFDLNIGDRIRHKDYLFEDERFYTVERIYPYIFQAIDDKGNIKHFSKAQYICAEVKRVGV